MPSLDAKTAMHVTLAERNSEGVTGSSGSPALQTMNWLARTP